MKGLCTSCVVDQAVAVPMLQGRDRAQHLPGIATGMLQHVAVNREGEAGTLANVLDQPIDSVGRERAAPLGRAVVLLASRLPASFRWEPRGSLRFMLRPRA